MNDNGLDNIKKDHSAITFTIVSIFVQFESFLTRAPVTSKSIFTNLIAEMEGLAWITLIDV